MTTTPTFMPIERKVIFLPLNGNIETDVSEIEIKFWKRQADTELHQLRDLIADISFQFSHVICGQICKKIQTHSQKWIKSIHNKRTLHARIYTCCQNHLVTLNCGDSILCKYHILMKEDLKSSTAFLEPNIPGSTTLKLSWIWHSGKWLLLNDNVFPEPTSKPASKLASKLVLMPLSAPLQSPIVSLGLQLMLLLFMNVCFFNQVYYLSFSFLTLNHLQLNEYTLCELELWNVVDSLFFWK